MAKPDPYRESLKKQFQELISKLKLNELQKTFLISRWLDQLMWMEGAATKARDRYYALRIVTIVGGVLLPALVSLNIGGNQVAQLLIFLTFAISQLVAISAALEEFFHYGERWRLYRRTSESLKSRGWQFFQLTGSYLDYKNHAEAFSIFSSHIEEIIQQDVEVYSSKVVQDKKQAEAQSESEDDNVETILLKSDAKITHKELDSIEELKVAS